MINSLIANNEDSQRVEWQNNSEEIDKLLYFGVPSSYEDEWYDLAVEKLASLPSCGHMPIDELLELLKKAGEDNEIP